MNVVITGASRGIGLAVAKHFAMHGHRLFLCSKNEYRLLQAIEELKTDFPGLTVDGRAMDLGRREQAMMFGEWVLNEADTVDVLVNNAGSFVQGNVCDEPDGVLEQMLEVNLYSAYYTTRAVLPGMKKTQSGSIFNICSIASLGAYPGGGSYSISKFALLGFTRNLRQELKPHGIKVTAVIPGAVYTDSWKGSNVPTDRIMDAADIAQMIYATTQLSAMAVVEDIVLRPQLGDL